MHGRVVFLSDGQPRRRQEFAPLSASQKPNARTYEVIGCGPLQDFLWTNSDYEARFIDAAHTDRSFHDFVKWCGLDDEDVGAQRIEDFDAKLKASPFARSHGA